MRRKNIFTTLLVIGTFILSLFLAIATYMLRGEVIDGNNIVYEEIENPLMNLGTTTIFWPTVSTDELAKSITSTDGEFDQGIFEDKFEENFKYKQSIIDDDWYTFDYEVKDDKMNVHVDAHVSMYNNSIITNSEHTYTYVLNTNE